MIARIDRLQVLLSAMLAALGVMTVFSARADWARQVAWVLAGALLYAAAMWFDYRRLRQVAPALYGAMLLMLVAVHLVGHTALGARRWLAVAGFPLEPSELSKLVLVVVLAAYLARSERVAWRGFGGALGLVAAPAALVLVQPDLGTTLVLLAVAFGMLFLAGARQAQLGSLVVAAIVAVPLLPHLLHGYQLRRLQIFLDPNQDPLGAGYNLLQARIAVGSGGLFGRGWLDGLQGQLGFVPERATDFVFATFAEEFGLLGSLVLLTLFGALLIRMLRASAVSADRFGELIAGGVFVMVLVQVVQNVGMNIGVLPIAGIPLPLISYGGSATITTLAALGLVQAFLFQADRAQHFSKVVLPALAEGKLVVTDRCFDASIAYQGHARGVGIELVARLSVIATQGHIPNLTILLDLDPSQVHSRTETNNDQGGSREEQTRFDKEAEEFHRRVREAFLTLARLYPERIKLLDASCSPEEIHEDIVALVKPLLNPS